MQEEKHRIAIVLNADLNPLINFPDCHVHLVVDLFPTAGLITNIAKGPLLWSVDTGATSARSANIY
jgi:hypothetical protein